MDERVDMGWTDGWVDGYVIVGFEMEDKLTKMDMWMARLLILQLMGK